jgi:hypothetical protein
MKFAKSRDGAATSAAPVPRGAERAAEIARIAADARARILAAPNPFDALTPEQRAHNRACPEPEILGSGPQRMIR